MILEWITEEPNLILTVKEVKKRLGVSNASARFDLMELAQKGYLSVLQINKVTRGFAKGSRTGMLPEQKAMHSNMPDRDQGELF